MNLSTFGHTGKFFLATPGKIHYPPPLEANLSNAHVQMHKKFWNFLQFLCLRVLCVRYCAKLATTVNSRCVNMRDIDSELATVTGGERLFKTVYLSCATYPWFLVKLYRVQTISIWRRQNLFWNSDSSIWLRQNLFRNWDSEKFGENTQNRNEMLPNFTKNWKLRL